VAALPRYFCSAPKTGHQSFDAAPLGDATRRDGEAFKVSLFHTATILVVVELTIEFATPLDELFV
jgi:hypothetical protein